MYKIVRNTRRFGKKTFINYNAARSYLRQYIRKHLRGENNAKDVGDTMHRAPNIGAYGFCITKVNAS